MCSKTLSQKAKEKEDGKSKMASGCYHKLSLMDEVATACF